MKTKNSRFLAFMLAMLLVLCQPVWAGAAEGPSTATDVAEALDVYERQPVYVRSYEGTANGTGSLYNTLSRYMVTDITVDEISYLAMQAAGYEFSGENLHSLRGATVQGETYEEFYPEEAALYELILEVFYEEVE